MVGAHSYISLLFTCISTKAVVIYMISIPHFLMSVHCCEIDADHWYYLIMTSQNACVHQPMQYSHCSSNKSMQLCIDQNNQSSSVLRPSRVDSSFPQKTPTLFLSQNICRNPQILSHYEIFFENHIFTYILEQKLLKFQFTNVICITNYTLFWNHLELEN